MSRDVLLNLCGRLGILDPWPKERPAVPKDPHHWFGNAGQLSHYLTPETLVLELGAWLGGSTRFLAQKSNFVITIDHWLGSPEHQLPHRKDVREKIPTLYETFLTNCWELRDKILPLRMDTKTGMRFLQKNGIVPDLIYVDADHSYLGCLDDLEEAWRFGPKVKLVGDDWIWGKSRPVQKAVTEFAEKRRLEIVSEKNFWALVSPDLGLKP